MSSCFRILALLNLVQPCENIILLNLFIKMTTPIGIDYRVDANNYSRMLKSPVSLVRLIQIFAGDRTMAGS
jgi:hypothetical protein